MGEQKLDEWLTELLSIRANEITRRIEDQIERGKAPLRHDGRSEQ